MQHYDKMSKTCCITPTLILPFSDEFCQLLRRNLAMLHVVVEHVEAIVFFTLGVRDRYVSHSGNDLSPVARTLPSRCSLKSSTISVCIRSRCVYSSFCSLVFISAILESNETHAYTGRLINCVSVLLLP